MVEEILTLKEEKENVYLAAESAMLNQAWLAWASG